MILDTEESLVEPSAAADTVFLDFLELLALDYRVNEAEWYVFSVNSSCF